MEFHISRTVRKNLDISELLFSYTGNVVFANVTASRKLAARLNDALGPDPDPADIVNAGALFAMGLIDELNHTLIARYREEIDPDLLSDAVRLFIEKVGPDNVQRLLLTFTEQFPNTLVFEGKLSAADWLAGVTDGMPNREAALEELMLLWLSNMNPAFTSFRKLFDDRDLKVETVYPDITSILPDYLNSRPLVAPEIGSLFEALRAPMRASPDSITGQLEFIRLNWPKYLGQDLDRVLMAIDVLREEDVAIWMRFHPPGHDPHRHAAPGWGAEGFKGNEFIGFDQEFGSDFITGPDGVRHRRYATDYQAPLVEYEAFSADQAWMPNVVLMAKSTYVWLEQLSKKYRRHIHHLDHIPDEELSLLAARGITGLWLIGLWERSIASKTIKRLRGQSDAVASAYSLKDYNIAEDLGGPNAYAHLRDRAAAQGIRLASDMVPNHMGIDSPWVIDHPEWFISRPESPFPVYQFDGPDISPDSRVEIKIEDHYYDQTDAAVVFRLRHHHNGSTRFVYHGNDGTSFAWNDTAQLDYSQADVREHVMQTILHVARQFPIIRFDAAMVLARRHVQRLWFPLPGAGGSIPSRAENAMSEEQFDALMPHEFWREVVDRVAVEVPGTLLLAEAFWLLEGYFVRTLGMHRVYNSAFMNMLRDEENAKYRSYLKKTIEFDPDILKRYVNFMSNPDERTAIDQFGSGDKYFGTCTLLATLPGLPMFGHGQIEGYTERYGMEFKRAKMDEYPNDDLVARHQHDIAPLLKNRKLFAESTNFVLYDFWTDHGTVDENVFAFSNRLHDQRAVVFYNNRYGSTRGSVHVSAASMNKADGSLRQTSLTEGLGIASDGSSVVAYRDIVNGLEYLRRATDLQHRGLSLELRGYQYVVLLNWCELRSTAEEPWGGLCDMLGGRGIHSVDDALSKFRLRSLHEQLHQVISTRNARLFAEIPAEPRRNSNESNTKRAKHPVENTSNSELQEQEPVTEFPVEKKLDVIIDGSSDALIPAMLDERFDDFFSKSEIWFETILESLPTDVSEPTKGSSFPAQEGGEAKANLDSSAQSAEPVGQREQFGLAIRAASFSALQLPRMGRDFSTAWPHAVGYMLPSHEPRVPSEQAWAPILAWMVLQSLPVVGVRTKIFDEFHLRSALAEIFASMGVDKQQIWRIAARIRILLLLEDMPEISITSTAFWADPDVRWLTGVHEAFGETYINQEQFEELLCWLQLPSLLKVGEPETQDEISLQEIERAVSRTCKEMKDAGYNLSTYLQRSVVKIVTSTQDE
jgi:glycosidase